MKRVTNGFARKGILHFYTMLHHITERMTNNPHFPTLQAVVQELRIEATRFEDLYIKALDGDKQTIIARTQSQQKLVPMLQLLGIHVSFIAAGNEAVLLSSGFPFTQDRRTTQPLSKPKPLKVQAGINKGELCCQTNRQLGMISINYYICANAAVLDNGMNHTDWKVVSVNKIKYTFKGLKAGERYFIRVGHVGVRSQEVLSDIVLYISQ